MTVINLGKVVYFQLSKQQLMYGPMQIESRIDQDQNISKDLTLWNQQGSRVLRGNVIALPVTDGFLYVESIYIQANEARMPQVKKVVLAMGDRLIYRDTFQEALAELTGTPAVAPPAVSAATSSPAAAPVATRQDLSDAHRTPQPSSRAGRTTGPGAGDPRKRNPEEIDLIWEPRPNAPLNRPDEYLYKMCSSDRATHRWPRWSGIAGPKAQAALLTIFACIQQSGLA